LVLSANFGQSGEAAAQSVPEPTGFALACMSLLGLALRRRRS